MSAYLELTMTYVPLTTISAYEHTQTYVYAIRYSMTALLKVNTQSKGNIEKMLTPFTKLLPIIYWQTIRGLHNNTN